jgi:glycosyltransferase involved in cell wall biosynthesis
VPLISVLMPVRDGGKHLDIAVQSILEQTHSKLELIIIDDHSTDQSIQNLPQDPRITRLNNPGKGIIDALNFGLEHALNQTDCEYVARMDADDIAYPERLTRQLEYQRKHAHISIVGAKVRMVGENVAEGYRHYEQWINGLTTPKQIALNMYVESPIPHPTVFAHREIWQRLRGYQEHGWPEDYDLWLRAHTQGMRFGKPQAILLDWRDQPSRLSRQDERYIKKSFYHAKIHYLAEQRVATQFCIWGTGPTALRVHDLLDKHPVQISGFIDVAEKMIGRQKRNKPVLSAWELEKTDNFILVAVASRGARDDIRSHLNDRGFNEGSDYLCVA